MPQFRLALVKKLDDAVKLIADNEQTVEARVNDILGLIFSCYDLDPEYNWNFGSDFNDSYSSNFFENWHRGKDESYIQIYIEADSEEYYQHEFPPELTQIPISWLYRSDNEIVKYATEYRKKLEASTKSKPVSTRKRAIAKIKSALTDDELEALDLDL
jgi:hypothetical protein